MLQLTPAALGLGNQAQPEPKASGAAPAPPSNPPDPPRRPERQRPAPAETSAQPASTQPGGIPLVPGFNLISLPRVPASTDPAAVFQPLGDLLDSVYAWDHCDPNEAWQVFDPVDPASSNLQAVDYRRGLWVDVASAISFAPEGTRPTITEIPLCAGWNLIGYPLDQPRPVPVALASIAGKYERVFGYDKADTEDPWEIYDPNVPDWANDMEVLQPGRGYWLLATENTVLRLANEGPPPQIAFTGPLDLDEVTAPVEVTAQVTSDLLRSWRLSFRPAGDEPWQELATGVAPLPSPLATFDPTLLRNGLYQLRLEATDFADQSTEEIASVVVDGGMKIGNLTLSFLDLSIPLSGLNVEVIRSYDSRDPRPGDFGAGWTLEVRRGNLRHNRPPGQGWQILPASLPCQRVLEGASHLTVVELSDQEIYRFRLGVTSPAVLAGGCAAQARFEFVAGSSVGATLEILGNTQVIYQNGGDQLLDADSLEVYEPHQARLRTRDGRVFDLDVAEGVTRLEDTNGNTLTFTDAGITHGSGDGVTFTRDAEGRIAALTDPAGGQWHYVYDSTGDLAAATDPVGNTTRFRYASGHRLQEIENARGKVALRNEYDAAGRLLRHLDAAGQVIEYQHDLVQRREVVRDRLGNERVLEYDARGNVAREVDAEGGETLRTYDERDNQLSEQDALGHITRYTYSSADDLLSLTDPLGNVTRFTYDASGRPLTTTDPLGHVTRYAYDGRGNLLQTMDAAGNVTISTYDLRGNQLTETDPLGAVTSFQYSANGQLIRQTDALGTATTFTYNRRGDRLTVTTSRTLADGSMETLVTRFRYDSAGRPTSITDPTGTTTSTTYNVLGNVVETIDSLGRTTRHTYNDLGLDTRTDYPDGTHDERAYDAEGELITRVDRAGRATSFAYYAAGRQLSTTYPDGSTMTSTYDDTGQLLAATDARGNTTSYAYDAAGRRTKVRDALGHEMQFAYDAVGNQTSFTDARGFTTSFEYDNLNQLRQTRFPDGTETQVGYDSANRRISGTDQAGLTTRFGYDPLGRLITVTDALGQITSYAYDEQGNRIGQTDANGHTTAFAYDAAGRQIRRTLPGGDSETFQYDAAGNLSRRTDFNGNSTTYGYDLANRLSQRSYPDGSAISFTYTATGQRASVTDARGITLYQYDARDRLQRLTYPDGRELRYAYDGAGNRTELTADLGNGVVYTTRYAYDALNRLQTVTDPQGGTYQHTYDENGNRALLSYPNGIEATYQYDNQNRLSLLASRNTTTGEVIQSYAYSLGPNGNRQRIDEYNGAVRTYGYDTLYRLIDEHTAGGSGPHYRNTFTYDPVGNRLTQDRADADDASQTITYSYDSRDRLLTEGSTLYGWDQNGNLISKRGAEEVTYYWDYESQLVGIDLADGTRVRNVYDADGVWVRSTVTAADGMEKVTNFLADTSGLLSHIVAETDGVGKFEAFFVRGDELLASVRPEAGTRFFTLDGLNSVRALLTDNGDTVASYNYSAFGEQIANDDSADLEYLLASCLYDGRIGLYYLQSRWMAPDVGQFLSADKLPQVSQIRGNSTYQYGDLNPVNRTDPLGLMSGFDHLLAAVVASVIATIGLNLLVIGTAAAVDFRVDGVLLSVRPVTGYRSGFFGAAGIDILLDGGGSAYVAPVFDFGLYPVSIFGTQRGLGYSVVAGPVFDMRSPAALQGWGHSASVPLSLLRYFPTSLFGKNGPYNFLMKISRARRSKAGLSGVIGFSSSRSSLLSTSNSVVSSFAQVGLRTADFSNSIGFTLPFTPLFNLNPTLQKFTDKWTVVTRELQSVIGEDAASVGRNADRFLKLIEDANLVGP